MEPIQEVTLRSGVVGRAPPPAQRHRGQASKRTTMNQSSEPTSFRMSMLVTQSLASSSMLRQPRQTTCQRCHLRHTGPCPSQRPQSVFSDTPSTTGLYEGGLWSPKDSVMFPRYSLDSSRDQTGSVGSRLGIKHFMPFHELKRARQAELDSKALDSEFEGVKIRDPITTTTQEEVEILECRGDVDSGYAWIILIVLFTINATTYGTARTYSQIIGKLAHEGPWNREQALMPFTIQGALENMAGPVCGCLLAITGSWRFTVVTGSLLVTLSHFLAALFAKSLIGQILFMGIICGLGQSFVIISFFQVINAYFDRYRNLAFGIGMTGAAVGALGLSPLCQYLLDNNDGTSMCYTILGLLMAPNVFLALLLRPQVASTASTLATSDDSNDEQQHKIETTKRRPSILMRQASQESQESIKTTTSVSSSPAALAQSSSTATQSPPIDTTTTSTTCCSQDQVQPKKKKRVQIKSISEEIEDEDNHREEKQVKFDEHDEEKKENDVVSPWSWIKLVVANPYFHLIWLTQLLYCWLNFVGMIIVDFGKDRGMSAQCVAYLVPCWTLGQLFGRLFLSPLVDLKLMSNKLFTIICFAAISATLLTLNNMQNSDQYHHFIVLAPFFLLSMSIALLYVLLNGLVVSYVDLTLQPISLGISSFIGSFFLLPRAYIGRIRDIMGNYDATLSILAYASLGAALVWLILPPSCAYIQKCHTKFMFRLAKRRSQKRVEQEVGGGVVGNHLESIKGIVMIGNCTKELPLTISTEALTPPSSA